MEINLKKTPKIDSRTILDCQTELQIANPFQGLALLEITVEYSYLVETKNIELTRLAFNGNFKLSDYIKNSNADILFRTNLETSIEKFLKELHEPREILPKAI